MRRLQLLRLMALSSITALTSGCGLVVLDPSGDVAAQQGSLVIVSTVLMLLIIVPVIALTFVFAWRYRASNKDAAYAPDWDHSILLELVIWAAPLAIIIALGAITWISTHTLDPYRPLERIDSRRAVPTGVKPLVIEVVAMDWKWLFIYPEQGIATVNDVAAPVDQPIHFRVTSQSVMNSFYVPALAGQIFAMPGMETTLHAVINRVGNYEGFSANLSGEGFSHMRFRFHGMAQAEFERWVQQARGERDRLGRDTYLALERPSERVPVKRYGSVAPDLYRLIVNRCVAPGTQCLHDTKTADARRVALMARAPGPGRSGAGWNTEDLVALAGGVCRASDPPGQPLSLSLIATQE